MAILESLKQSETKKRLRFILKLVIYVSLVFFLSYNPGRLEDFGIPQNLINSLLFYFAGHLIISFSRILIVFWYLRTHHFQKEVKNNFVIGINRIADILGIIIFLIALLILFNKNPVEFVTSLSIVAAAIAILSKDYISNMINGMILMFSNEISIGDHVKIGDNRGKIVDFTLINAHMVNEDEDLIFIPNNMVMNSEIINFTKRSVRKLSFEFDVKNNLLADVAELENYLYEALADFHSYIKDNTFMVKILKINENFTALKVQFVITKTVIPTVEKEIRKKTLRSVLRYTNTKEL